MPTRKGTTKAAAKPSVKNRPAKSDPKKVTRKVVAKKPPTTSKSATKKTKIKTPSTCVARIFNPLDVGDSPPVEEIGDGVFWIGIRSDDAFQCNPYIIVDGDQSVLIDPGGLLYADAIVERVKSVTDPSTIRYIIAHHQDPDVCSSLNAFRPIVHPDCEVVCHSRMSVLIKHFGAGFPFFEVDKNNWRLSFGRGRVLTFAHTPYVHSPGAIVTYDRKSKTAFTSDIFGGITPDWELVAEASTLRQIQSFHVDYMPSMETLEFALHQISNLGEIKQLAPQHGSIIRDDLVSKAFDMLLHLEVGTYADQAFAERIKLRKDAVRMKALVDNASIRFMAADELGTIVYINDAAAKLFSKFEHLLPCKSTELVGRNIDIFHADPAFQQSLLHNPKKSFPRERMIKFGEFDLKITAFAIYNNEGAFMGPAVVWEDMTEKMILDARDKGIKKKVAEMADLLTESSQSLKDVSFTMTSAAEETSAQAHTVSDASVNVADNINQVVAAIEEMSASVSEIAKNASRSSNIASDSVSLAKKTNAIVSRLGDSSREIGKVIKVISSIARQTNLLALNATIEAARAGDMGKGFAVVANAVKELSKETSISTEEITEKIGKIQNDATEAVKAIEEITEIIGKINDTSTTIASAVEEQSVTSNEISRNMSMAARGVDNISENINHLAQAATDASKGASDTLKSAEYLTELSGNLLGIVKTL
jgi:methyl-accepting chemotaxis protein